MSNLQNTVTTTAQEIIALNTAANSFLEQNGSSFILVPENYELKNVTQELAKALPYAPRKTGTCTLLGIESFIKYCADQNTLNGYIYADVNAKNLTAVFNDYRVPVGGDLSQAGWRDHRASFSPAHTPEATTWLASNKKGMDQATFSEFLEDNAADIGAFTGMPTADELLNVAGTLSSKTSIQFNSSRRLDNGQVQLTYNETIDSKAGAAGTLEIPRSFALALRLFQGDKTGYRLDARLKYRLNNGSVKFWYELDRPERAIEDAFSGYIEKVTAETSFTVLLGKA